MTYHNYKHRVLLLCPARIKTALSKILQDCDQWIRTQNMSLSISSPIPMSPTFAQLEVMPTAPPSTIFGHVPNGPFGLKVFDIYCIWFYFALLVLEIDLDNLSIMGSLSELIP